MPQRVCYTPSFDATFILAPSVLPPFSFLQKYQISFIPYTSALLLSAGPSAVPVDFYRLDPGSRSSRYIGIVKNC